MDNRIEVILIQGESCASCYSMEQVLLPLMKKYSDVKFKVLQAIDSQEVVLRYRIQYVPTLLILANEKEVARVRGFQPDEILEIWLDDKIDQARKEIIKED